jgi:cytochrome c peroxidase
MKPIVCLTIIFCAILSAKEPIVPIPQTIPHDRQKAALGKELFADPILSKDRTISCLSCHNPANGGSDGQKVSTGIHGLKGSMNSPSVYNSVFNFSQFWNGRAKNLQEQALGPIHNPIEMGLSKEEAVFRLNKDPRYQEAFRKITKRDRISADDITAVIAEYEKTLITPNAKFDLFLKGKATLSPSEKEGYTLFKTLGCVTCHNGVNVGGNSFQKMGVIFPVKRAKNVQDRHNITKREIDKLVFKVPTLRNIALTAPYFHDGSVSTLEEAVKKMAFHNLGIELTKEESADLVAFLHTLNGKLPKGSF